MTTGKVTYTHPNLSSNTSKSVAIVEEGNKVYDYTGKLLFDADQYNK